MATVLVGAGPMAIEYAKVLTALQKSYSVVCRGEISAQKFFQNTGFNAVPGGIDAWLDVHGVPDKAIIAVGEKDLGIVTTKLLNKGVKEILVEKPGGFDADDIKKVYNLSCEKNARVFIAYNRRFYASAIKARQIIHDDGGVLSFQFEFTEWVHKISDDKIRSGIGKQWFLANSTHVIDLAFFLCGEPVELNAFAEKKLGWHDGGSIFCGCGKTKTGALFSYHANWISAGRWGIEICTPKHRLIFRPLETLKIQNMREIETSDVALDDGYDTAYKPGIYREVESFFGDKKNLPTIEDQIIRLPYLNRINSVHN